MVNIYNESLGTLTVGSRLFKQYPKILTYGHNHLSVQTRLKGH